MWIMHVQAYLLHGVEEVRPSDSKVLQCAGETPVGEWIADQLTIRSGELAFDIHQHRDRLAVGHPSTLEDVLGVLLL